MTAQAERTNEIGRRYAKAAFALAKDAKVVDKATQQLAELRSLIADNSVLAETLSNPVYTRTHKADAVMAIAKKAKAHDVVVKALGLMAENGRADDIPEMVAAFKAMATAENQVVHAEVTSATPLPDKHIKAVTDALKKTLGTTPELTATVDPEILGGLKVRVGSRLMDASLKSQLDQMTHMMKRA